MDFEESSHGTSNSNSSVNSWQQSDESPAKDKKVSLDNSATSNSSSRRSRAQSRASNENVASPRSDSQSSSSSSSSENDNNEEEDPKNSSSSGSESSSEIQERHSSPLSPVKSRSNSISRGSTNHSRSNSPENRCVPEDININHDDLSDVSDTEPEKRGPSSPNDDKSLLEMDRSNASTVDTNTSEKISKFMDKEDDTSMGNDCPERKGETDLRQKLDQKKNQQKALGTGSGDNANGKSNPLDDLVKTHDEDALDFEAEEGECQELEREEVNKNAGETQKDEDNDKSRNNGENNDAKDEEELEEGEVTDEDEKRPEETEPKPVCRFYTRGQCTWGMNCRFLHPGVTDKGNYTMFDLVRPVPMPPSGPRSSGGYGGHQGDYHDFRSERPPLHTRPVLHHPTPSFGPQHDHRVIPDAPVVVESAWERGLRTAKEMMRKANKRKEQDIDFEDKKMNLALSPEELEKDQFYLKERERGSPPESVIPFGRHNVYPDGPGGVYNPPDRFNRGPPPPIAPYDDVDPYGRTSRYRELPPHRMPQYEDERRVRPTREVIVQRVESVVRGDEWNDPWMRSKSPGGHGGSRDRLDKRRRDHRSYSSNSSYSSSSSSHSDSSSDSSRSPTPVDHRRRYVGSSHKSPIVAHRHAGRPGRSPSPLPRHARHSESFDRSPMAKRRGHNPPSPLLDKRSIYSPVAKRKKTPPIRQKSSTSKAKLKRRRSSSSSGSGSSDTSASDSESDSGSSSSESSSRDHTPPKRGRGSDKISGSRKATKPDSTKKRSPILIELKKPAAIGASALTSPRHPAPPVEKESKKSRREELLKQLRAVEDAIAKKRSKLA